MSDEIEKKFEEWVASEDKHGGVFANNNNFTRDHWIAERAFLAGHASCEKQIRERFSQCGCGDVVGLCGCLRRENEGLEFRVNQLRATVKAMAESLEDFVTTEDHALWCEGKFEGKEHFCKCMDRFYYNKDACISRAKKALTAHAEIIEKCMEDALL